MKLLVRLAIRQDNGDANVVHEYRGDVPRVGDIVWVGVDIDDAKKYRVIDLSWWFLQDDSVVNVILLKTQGNEYD